MGMCCMGYTAPRCQNSLRCKGTRQYQSDCLQNTDYSWLHMPSRSCRQCKVLTAIGSRSIQHCSCIALCLVCCLCCTDQRPLSLMGMCCMGYISSHFLRSRTCTNTPLCPSKNPQRKRIVCLHIVSMTCMDSTLLHPHKILLCKLLMPIITMF